MTLANAVAPDWIGALLQYGGVGVCLAWFMFRSEPRLRAIELNIHRMSRVIMNLSTTIYIALEAQGHHGPAQIIRAQSDPLLKELDDVDEQMRQDAKRTNKTEEA